MILRYTDTAVSEIDGILSFIAEDDSAAAARVAGAIERSIADIVAAPGSAPVVYEPGVHAKLVRGHPYRIFYMLHADELLIRNVRSTRRQLPWKRT